MPSRRVLITLRESPKGKPHRGQYLLAVDLSRYKWYQSQIPGDVPAGRLSPEGVDMRLCASKNVGPQRGWIGWGSHIDWRKERVPARTRGFEGGGL